MNDLTESVPVNTMAVDVYKRQESKLYEIATFKNGKYDTAIKYYLVETKTLDGYTLDQTKHEVTSVSYTHLDVYKRQVYTAMRLVQS